MTFFWAEALGLRIETGCEVRTIHSSSSHVVVVAHQRGQPKQFMADKVVMAAGTLGTNEILLRSGFGRSHPSLGKGFYCHPSLCPWQTCVQGWTLTKVCCRR